MILFSPLLKIHEGEINMKEDIHVKLSEELKIDGEKLQKVIQDCLEKSESTLGKDIVLFIGNTGKGKSTLINYLLGCEMAKTTKGNVEVSSNSEIKSFCKIGETRKSETRFIKVIKTNLGYDYIDCPGFNDTGDNKVDPISIRISNAFNIQRAVNSSNSVKAIVVVLALSDIEEKDNKSFEELCGTLNSFIKSREEIAKNILFCVTKTQGKLPEEIFETIKDARNDIEKELQESKNNKNKKLISDILNLMNSNNVIPIPAQELFENNKEIRRNIQEKIKKFSNIEKNKFQFNFPERERVKDILIEIVKESSNKSSNDIKLVSKESEEFIEKFRNDLVYRKDKTELFFKEEIDNLKIESIKNKKEINLKLTEIDEIEPIISKKMNSYEFSSSSKNKENLLENIKKLGENRFNFVNEIKKYNETNKKNDERSNKLKSFINVSKNYGNLTLCLEICKSFPNILEELEENEKNDLTEFLKNCEKLVSGTKKQEENTFKNSKNFKF